MSSRPDAAGVIEVSGLTKTFDRGRVRALDGLDLAVDAGAFVAVTGPSGCGKSTLLHLLAALDRPDAGRICVGGVEVSAVSNANRYRRHDVGLVFQMHNLLPHLDARRNIEIAMLGTGRRRRERRARSDELMAAVGIPGLGGRRPPELSGGERQRVAIARALANEPGVILADEPTGSLDSEAVEQVLALFERLRAERGVTILMVTHDDDVADRADRIVRMRDGRVVDDPAVTPAIDGSEAREHSLR